MLFCATSCYSCCYVCVNVHKQLIFSGKMCLISFSFFPFFSFVSCQLIQFYMRIYQILINVNAIYVIFFLLLFEYFIHSRRKLQWDFWCVCVSVLWEILYSLRRRMLIVSREARMAMVKSGGNVWFTTVNVLKNQFVLLLSLPIEFHNIFYYPIICI